MIKTRVIKPFLFGEEQKQPGQDIELSKPDLAKWAGLGFVEAYETKVQPKAEVKAVKKSSPASRPATASRKKTAKKRTKKAK